MRHHAPSILPLMAEAYMYGMTFTWLPDGLKVNSTRPVPADLFDELKHRAQEIREVLYRAQISYDVTPPLVHDPNNENDYPLTRDTWTKVCPHDGWPASSHDHGQGTQ